MNIIPTLHAMHVLFSNPYFEAFSLLLEIDHFLDRSKPLVNAFVERSRPAIKNISKWVSAEIKKD